MLDMSMGWGSALAGHAHPRIVDSVAVQARQGTNFACINEQSLTLAEELVRLSPACELVRICASGTEATMYCARLARTFTDRRKILKFEGAYHGSHDIGIARLFPPISDTLNEQPSVSQAANERMGDDILVATFNDLASVERLVAAHANDVAGII